MDGSQEVREYYNRNTRRFISLGHGGSQLAIRRAVWAPGVESRPEAIEYANHLILEDLATVPARDRLPVVDLGCGVGGSIRYLAARLEGQFVGVTLSDVQADAAAAHVAPHHVICGDIGAPDVWWQIGNVAAAYAIESLLHVPDQLGVLNALAAATEPGGRMVVVDDMLVRKPSGRREERLLAEFRAGWHALGLSSFDQLVSNARQAGFALERSLDLTPYLELDRPRDRCVRVFMALTRRLPIRAPWFHNLLGGNALQQLLKSGVIQYRYTVFRRSGA